MTTLKDLKKALEHSEPWNGENPVRVLIAGNIMEIEEIHDIGFNGGAEGIILVCRTVSSQKVPLGPSLWDSGSKTPDGFVLPA